MSAMSIWIHALLFLVASATIWWAGTRLVTHADTIATRTRLGQAFTGMLLLASATSLPEVATTLTAVVVLDDPTLAVHNLLGGVALQTAMLVVADRVMPKKGALTFFSPRFVLLVEGVGLVMLLQVVIAGIAARGVPVVGSTSVWMVVTFGVYLGLMVLTYRYRSEGRSRWTPVEAADLPAEEGTQEDAEGGKLRSHWLWFAATSLLVLGGGWLATTSADVLAERTGLGSAFVGATLLALATSLPELSTTIAAVRRGRYTMAISNVFGSNAFDVSLLLLAEVAYRQGTILAHAEPTVVLVASTGAIMTCLYLWGLMEREDRRILGVGWDSFAALLVYLGAMGVLYVMT